MAKKPNKATQQAYKQAIEYGCIVCKKKYGVYTQPCIHHITGAGMALKNKEFIPLCHHHHQGGEGIHTLGTKVWEEKYGRQRDLLREFKEVCQEKLN
jgi:hypothetical protein|tara:strand:+ start:55 stop:345 length:291 start_codon:yes stop_codon:yes gene_type:complete